MAAENDKEGEVEEVPASSYREDVLNAGQYEPSRMEESVERRVPASDSDEKTKLPRPNSEDESEENEMDAIFPFDRERILIENDDDGSDTELSTSDIPSEPTQSNPVKEATPVTQAATDSVEKPRRKLPAPRQKQKKPRRKSSPSPPRKPLKRKPKKSKDDEELIRLALHRNPFFTCLDEEQIERFIEEAELVHDFRPGQAVIVEGPSSEPQIGKAQLRRMRTIVDDVYGDDEGDDSLDAHEYPSDSNTEIAESDELWWIEENDDLYYNATNKKKKRLPHEHQDGAKSSYLYIIRNGHADIFYQNVNPATLGPSRMFGEGGFLFGRNHSASVVAATDSLECFRVDRHTFIHKILPSQNMKRLYRKYATTTPALSRAAPPGPSSPNDTSVHRSDTKILIEENIDQGEVEDDIDFDAIDELIHPDNKSKNTIESEEREDDKEETFVMTMNDFLEFFKKERGESTASSPSSSNHSSLSPIVNAYQSILRGTSSTYHDENNNITLEDFCFFHFLMARPDPEIDIAFILMDRSKSGTIARKDFERYLERSAPHFSRDCEFIERHFGDGRVIRAHQFSQFLHDLQRELGRQAFLHRVQEQARKQTKSAEVSMADPHIGYLPAEVFIEVLKATSSWRLPDGVIDRLESLYCKPSIDSAESTALASVRAGTIKGDSPKKVAEYSRKAVLADLERRRNKLGMRHFAYVDFIAFQDLLVQLPAICNLIERSCQIKKGPISSDDFKVANRVLGIGGRLSRQQVNIVFDLFDLDHDGYLSYEDAISVCGLEVGSNVLEAVKGRDGLATFAPPPNYPQNNPINEGFGYNDDGLPKENASMEEWMMTQTAQFLLSSIAGGFGIFMVYPLDLIKTRMMNQRAPGVNGARLYYTTMDCFQKVIRYEGFHGLYRGLLPPLLAAGPEKFVKFTVNDMLRSVLSKDDGSSTEFLTEMVSGGCAGACQLLVTNPLEIVKIRMQIQGETARIFQTKGFDVPKGLGLHYMSFTQLVKDFGMTGLYKGAAACLMRDIPFGAIYFPAYAAFMDYFVNREGSAGASSSNILLSGTLAAVPASLLTNPMDLIKTRMQVATRPGDEVYTGIGDCIRKIHQTEGPWAFFKGSFPRVARIAPQFGLSMYAYETLSKLIGFRGIAPPTNAPVNPRDYRTAFSSVSSGIESKAIDAESLIENIGLFKPPR